MTKAKLTTTLALVAYACIAFAQQTNDSTVALPKEKRPVKLSLLSNYYDQDGDRGATNGGIGSQQLYSYTQEGSIYIPIKEKSALKLNGGVDYYTAASYLEIDKYKTAASSGKSGVSVDETRKYGGIGFDIADKKKTTIISPSVGFSTEYDVNSYNAGLGYAKLNTENGSAITVKGTAIIDRWMLIYPGEYRTGVDAQTGASDKGAKILPYATPISVGVTTVTKDGKTYGTNMRRTYALSNSYAFNINQRMNGLVGLDLTLQQGQLSTPFYRVYFRDGVTDEYTKTARIEKLPEKRQKATAYARYNWFVNSMVVIRTNARFYTDNWGIKAFTAGIELPVKVIPAISVAPFYRFHVQSKSKYFAGYGRHELNDEFYTSDFDLADFYSNKFGGTLRIVPFRKLGVPKVFNIKSLDLRYAKYLRSDGLDGQTITAELNLEF